MIKIRPILDLVKDKKCKEALDELRPSMAPIKSFLGGYIKEPYSLFMGFGAVEPLPPLVTDGDVQIEQPPLKYGIILSAEVRNADKTVMHIGLTVTVIQTNEGQKIQLRPGMISHEKPAPALGKEFMDRLVEYCQGEWSLFGRDVLTGKEKNDGKR